MNMKNFKIKKVAGSLLIGLALCVGFTFQACDDNPDKYETASGVPEVYYVRLPKPSTADSLIVQAYMDNTICLVGSNLRSIREIWFNDQKAVLNSSFITDQTLLVTIPKTIPRVVTNKMYMVVQNDTISYAFGVQVPKPIVSSISCEYTHDGDLATLNGDYFIDDPNVPLTITMAGNIPVTEITKIEKTKVTFRVPSGSEKGYINVKSIYGTSRSNFQFRDDRGMILDWDNKDATDGWRPGVIGNTNPTGITGNYVRFQGTMDGEAGATWNEDAFSFNLWGPADGRPEGDLFTTDPATSILKFEVNVVESWSAGALQMIFTPWATTKVNSYLADKTVARGLWRPWETTGSYTTNGWITVSIPLKEFKYDHTGAMLQMPGKGNYGGLTFFVFHGGINGTTCTPHICIDNIRVVPAE